MNKEKSKTFDNQRRGGHSLVQFDEFEAKNEEYPHKNIATIVVVGLDASQTQNRLTPMAHEIEY